MKNEDRRKFEEGIERIAGQLLVVARTSGQEQAFRLMLNGVIVSIADSCALMVEKNEENGFSADLIAGLMRDTFKLPTK
jgi:hypothetical protein